MWRIVDGLSFVELLYKGMIDYFCLSDVEVSVVIVKIERMSVDRCLDVGLGMLCCC